jgi:hypothetical protein
VQDGVTGLLVRRARPVPLAAAITKLLLDEDRRCQMAASAIEWSRHFRWEYAAAALLSAVRCTAAKGTPVRESPRSIVPSSVVRGRAPLDTGVLS